MAQNGGAAAAASDDTSSGSGSGGGNGNGNGNGNGAGGSGSGSGSGAATLKKGPWTAQEDAILMEYVQKHGEGNWNAVQNNSGLSRCGKSCRLRWANHLRPNLKKGQFTPDEERLILDLHSKLGNKWARMAAQLPGRTDNEIKNYWNTRVKRRQRAGLPLYPHDIQKNQSTFHLQPNNPNQHPPISQSPPQLTLSSSQQQKPSFLPSLSLYDPINFSTQMPLLSHESSPSFLSSQAQGFKRFRSNSMGFSNPFSIPPTSLPPQSSNLFSRSLLPNPNLQFYGNFELDSSLPLLQQHFQPNGAMGSGSSYMRTELPSLQPPLPAAPNVFPGPMNGFKISSSSYSQSNSGLLDALLQETETVRGGEDGRKGLLPSDDGKDELNDFLNDAPSSKQVFSEGIVAPPLQSANRWDKSNSGNLSAGLKLTIQHREEMDSVDDDLSSLLDIIPSSMLVSDLYNEGAETSNGQSSVTDDDLGMDMHQLPPCSLPATTTSTTNNAMDQHWSNGPWNIPEMC